MFKRLLTFSVKRPWIIVVSTLVLVILSIIQFPKIKVDTDPENMLSQNASVRVFHRQMKKEFSIYDLIVVGVVNPKNSQGVFNAQTLSKIYNITQEIKNLDGVIAPELISLSTKDDIQQDGVGAVKFNWLMPVPPKTDEEALEIRTQAQNHPLFYGTVVSEDGKALSIYVPIVSKDLSYEITQKIKKITQKYPGEEEFYFTGLPIANDQFGAEMFKQMAVSAPLAGLVIFLLMWLFFHSINLILAPMILAIVTVLMTMGLLIGMGFSVHIMSSMIPIFLMPIAVLDSVHILSEFFDKYKKYNDKQKTILYVMEELFSPMLFTSLTSAVGFFSLSFSPIPPVQVFGIFVALGVAFAWILTMTFIPAYIMLLNPKNFSKFSLSNDQDKSSIIDRVLIWVKGISMQKYKVVISVSVVLVLLSFYGISKIKVNDNPVRWFTKSHPIRVADKVLNEHFSGTYQLYLVLSDADNEQELFIRPKMLNYVENLQKSLQTTGLVGKSTSLTDLVKKVYYELLGGDKQNSRIPDSQAAVAQCLISFENSHKPDDLWHFTTPDYSKLNLWLQLKSGDNRDVEKVVKYVAKYINDNPPAYKLNFNWAGLSYINVIWQNNMVLGMLKNFLGSFIIVLFMMLFLFRSPVKALVSMIPLSITILFIYSLLGFFGKDYDMPIAVLSALTLGLSIDFAIHFIQRATEIYETNLSWDKTSSQMFSGPGRAIIRNALVVAIGFLPLLAAPLVPYKTVGFFMFMIMAVSSVATLFILPSIISANPKLMFSSEKKGLVCKCGNCMLISLFVMIAVLYVLLGYTSVTWGWNTFISISVIVVSAGFCSIVSKRKICLSEEKKHENK